MLGLMYDQFFWPCMAAQAKEHISKCHLCLAFKAKQPKAPLENIVATHPFQLCLEPGKGLEENVLIVTDKFIVHYWLPEKILSHQGQNFESQLVADLCELMGMQKIWTSPYHPQTSSQW